MKAAELVKLVTTTEDSLLVGIFMKAKNRTVPGDNPIEIVEYTLMVGNGIAQSISVFPPKGATSVELKAAGIPPAWKFGSHVAAIGFQAYINKGFLNCRADRMELIEQ